MKRLLIILSLIAVLVALVSCGGDTPTPPISGLDSTEPVSAGGDDNTEAPPETVSDTKPAEDDFEPDPDAVHSGAAGLGAAGGTVYFDDMKVIFKATKKTLYKNDFEDGLGDFTLKSLSGGTPDAGEWTLQTDPSLSPDSTKLSNSLCYMASDANNVMVIGNTDWNYYQFTCKTFIPEDIDSEVYLYFAYIDEKNYSMLVIGEGGGQEVNCYKVVNGEKSQIAYKATVLFNKGEWLPLGVTLDREFITIFIKGMQIYSLYDPSFTNQYFAYNGEVNPASVSQFGYGAPGEGETYLVVDPANVIHDGKGTWNNQTDLLPTLAFDYNIDNYYQSDEACEYVNTDAEMVGIPGDGTFETAYVGAYYPEGVRVCHIRYCPRSDRDYRMNGGIFQGSVDGVEWKDIYTVPETPPISVFTNVATTDNTTVFHYVRYVGPKDCYANASEIEFWGFVGE